MSDPRRIRYRCSSRTATLGDDAGGSHTETAVASRSCRFDIAGTGGGSPDASSLSYRQDDEGRIQHDLMGCRSCEQLDGLALIALHSSHLFELRVYIEPDLSQRCSLRDALPTLCR